MKRVDINVAGFAGRIDRQRDADGYGGQGELVQVFKTEEPI